MLRRLGVSALLVLVMLRATNFYGETLPWHIAGNDWQSTGDDWQSAMHTWQSAVQTLLSFFNFTKYPPSLDFLLLTLGVMALLLASLEQQATQPWFQPIGKVLANFGAAPMFFYLLHLYALLLMYAIAVSQFGVNKGTYFGVDAVWQFWLIAGLLATVLYLPTRWFASYKQRSKAAWVRYL